MLVKDYKRKTYLIFDMLVPEDNISVKEYKEIDLYNDLEIEIQKNGAH